MSGHRPFRELREQHIHRSRDYAYQHWKKCPDCLAREKAQEELVAEFVRQEERIERLREAARAAIAWYDDTAMTDPGDGSVGSQMTPEESNALEDVDAFAPSRCLAI